MQYYHPSLPIKSCSHLNPGPLLQFLYIDFLLSFHPVSDNELYQTKASNGSSLCLSLSDIFVHPAGVGLLSCPVRLIKYGLWPSQLPGLRHTPSLFFETATGPLFRLRRQPFCVQCDSLVSAWHATLSSQRSEAQNSIRMEQYFKTAILLEQSQSQAWIKEEVNANLLGSVIKQYLTNQTI